MSSKKNQIKSKFYYYFWGAATISVLAGQLYVGTGYRLMAEASDKTSTTVEKLTKFLSSSLSTPYTY
jgi:hypothetical protein